MTGSLRPIRSDVDESLSAWYKANSRVYVSNDHLCWHDPKMESKLKKKRFGTVIRSPVVSLGDMMQQHEDEVCEFVARRCVVDDATKNNGDSTEDDAMTGPAARAGSTMTG